MRQHTVVVDIPDEVDDDDAEKMVTLGIEAYQVRSSADRRAGYAFGDRHTLTVAEYHRERMLQEES